MRKKLEESINKLKNQVDQIEDSKITVKKEMHRLLDDLDHQLEHPEDGEHRQKLSSNLTELIAKFELEHPKLAETLNEIMVIFSNMGI